jgi:PAS domain S-box-containing protein
VTSSLRPALAPRFGLATSPVQPEPKETALAVDPSYRIGSIDYRGRAILAGECALGTPVSRILPDVPLELIGSARRRADHGSPSEPFETVARRLNGDAFLAELTRLPGNTEFPAEPLLLRLLIRDLSDLPESEQRVRRQRLREQQILNATRSMVLGVDRHTKIDFANPASGRVLSKRLWDFFGADAFAVTGLAQPDGSPFLDDDNPVLRTLEDGISRPIVASSVVRRDGTRLLTELSCSAIVEGGELAGAVLVINDVTERETAQRRKDEFLSTISHELRSPLTSIRGSLGMLAGGVFGELAPDAAQMVDVAMSNTHRLIRLVNDLLHLERLASGRVPMQPVDLDLADAAAEVLRQQAPVATQRNLVLKADLLAAPVVADAHQISIAVTNLLSNAMKFSADGGSVTVSTRSDAEHAWVTVRDEGRGIPADQLSSIFDRFQQVEAGDATVMGGSGLGLSITGRIARALGGRVDVQSSLGVGSRFTLELPRAVATQQED